MQWSRRVSSQIKILRVRLNYATTRHHPPPAKIYPPPPTTSQNISTTTNHHPKPAKTYLPPHTTTHKMDHHSVKAKIYFYITSFWHCFNSFFFYKMQYSFPWRRFCVIKFWSVCFSNSKFQWHFTYLRFFKFIFQEFKVTRFIIYFYK